MWWPSAGQLQGQFEQAPEFVRHKWIHTNVTHKRKIGQRIQYVAPRRIRVPDGTDKWVLGGTQKVDGFWAWLRRAIGRSGVNTGKQGDDVKRIFLSKLVRVAQWRSWNLEKNRFELLGSILRDRALQGEQVDFF